MGARGELWVVLQGVLLLVYAVAPWSEPAWTNSAMTAAVGWGFALAGGVLFACSVLNLGRSLTPLPRPLRDGRLVTQGAYALVRHPIYSAVILGTAGYGLVTENWLRLAITVVLFIFFDLKARAEERWLLEQYPEYATYKTRVKKLVPWIY